MFTKSKLAVPLPLLLILSAATDRVPADERSNIKLLSGKPRLMIVNGYSTSFRWPAVLQRKLNKYFDGEQVIEVRSATKGSTPIARWMDVESGKPLRPWTDVLRPALRKNDGRPVVVLGQQSLQWVFGNRASGIRNARDRQHIAQGAEVLKRYTDLLLSDGADEVFVAMHIFKKGMEPAIGNERFALAEFLKNDPPHVHVGPDVWQPMKAQWPLAFAADKVHPNSIGAEIMAQHWFETLLKYDGLKVPAWSREEMLAAIKNGPQQAAGSGKERPLRRAGKGRDMSFKGIAARHDRNKDGKITSQEFRAPQQVFQRLDRNKDGVLTGDDFGSSNANDSSRPQASNQSRRDRSNSNLSGLAAELFPNYSPRKLPNKYGGTGVQRGQRIQDVVVYTLEGKETKLSSLWKDRPAVLLTASMTCGPACNGLPNLNPLKEHFGDKLSIGILYILESHPFGEASPYYPGGRANTKKRADGKTYKQPKKLAARLQHARTFNSTFKPPATILVDGIGNAAWKVIGEGPNIGLFIEQGGVVAYKQGWFDAASMVNQIENSVNR